MTQITIDNKQYDLDNLSDDAKAQLASIQFVDSELARLQAKAAALQTARLAYSKALQAALPANDASWHHQPLKSFVEADFWLELAQIQAESIGWIPLEEGAYLHVGSDELVIQVVGVAKAEMADSNVLWLT